jgi:DNA modification methylase
MSKVKLDLFGQEDLETLRTLNRGKDIPRRVEKQLPQAKKGCSLLRNVQFIYELALAKKELISFGLDFHIANDFRIFEISSPKDANLLKRRLAYFESINGTTTDYYHIIKYNQTSSVNQYLTHWIYPYKGKFHPQMIRALLNIMQVKEGETVLDPFVGSGTAALECQLLAINFIGIDISPLCYLLSRVKTESIEAIEEIEKIKKEILSNPEKIKNIKNEKVQNFFTIAQMVAHSDSARRRRNYSFSFHTNTEKMLKSLKDYLEVEKRFNLKLGKVNIVKSDVRNLDLEDESIDGIITSPPYSIALNYVINDAHSLQALGYDVKKISEDFIGVRGSGLNKFKLYDNDMAIAYKQMYRVLKKGKYCVVVIGNVTFQGEEIDTTQIAIDTCLKIGFKLVSKMEKIIYGLYNVMQKEYILIFKKE